MEEHSDQLEQRLGGWIGAAEDVLCDILGKEGQERDRWRGRAHGPRFVWKSALGTPAKPTPFTTRVSRSWAKIVGWCATIKQARAHEGARRDRDHPLAWSAYVSRRRVLAARKWDWGAGEEGVVLKTFVHEFAKVDLWSDNGELTALFAWAEEEANKAGRKAAVESTKRYREWLQQGPAKGLSRQHAASKCRGQWVPGKMVKERTMQDDGIAHVLGQWEGEEEVTGLEQLVATIQKREEGDMIPASAQQEVDEEGLRWAGVWAEGMEMEECRWPEAMEALPDIEVHHILEAVGTFKDGVGLGWDRFHPKAMRRLPRELLAALGSIMKEAERLGSWSSIIGIVITALIPKGGGGWRPIGLLPSIVGVFARVRAGMVKEWEAENDREYLFGGTGKGALVAA